MAPKIDGFLLIRALSVHYVLIGGGTTSYYAALTIRARDPDAKILIVDDEPQTPDIRVLLSKGILKFI